MYVELLLFVLASHHRVPKQFCGDDPVTIVRAAEFVQHEVAAVDLNLGCPQKIARKGH